MQVVKRRDSGRWGLGSSGPFGDTSAWKTMLERIEVAALTHPRLAPGKVGWPAALHWTALLRPLRHLSGCTPLGNLPLSRTHRCSTGGGSVRSTSEAAATVSVPHA